MESKKRTTSLFLVLLVIALAFYLLDRASLLSPLRGGIELFVGPGQKTVRTLTAPEGEEVDESTIQRSELEKLTKENEGLRLQLGIAKEAGGNKKQILATVLSTSRAFMIDKGERDGIRVGNTVLFKNIFVGKVAKTSRYVSRVLLPIEKESVVNAKDSKTGARGLVKGKGSQAFFTEVTHSEELFAGDTVVTIGEVDEEGLGIWPNLLIGTIEDVRRSEDPLYQEAKLLPLVVYETLTHVFVIP